MRRALEELAGRHLDGGIVGPYTVGGPTIPEKSSGVYVVFDSEERCAYVGKAFSLLDANRGVSRIHEHVRELRKREVFATFYVLPLRAATTVGQVERIEGWVARHMRPTMGTIHPNPLRRGR